MTIPTIPTLTHTQRSQALARAARARTRRAEAKTALKRGQLPLSAFLDEADGDEVLARMRVLDLLQSLPRVGLVTARALMEEVGISPSRRVQGLGPHQRAALVERFG